MSPRISVPGSHPTLLSIAIALVAGGCSLDGFKQPARSHALDGMMTVATRDSRDAQQHLIVTAGPFTVGPLPAGWTPLHIGGQAIYQNMAFGESCTVVVNHSPKPMDAAQQSAVLQAMGQTASSAEKLVGMFGGARQSPPEIKRTSWGTTMTFQGTGPMVRVATHYLAVTATDGVWIKIEGQVGRGDPGADAIAILSSLKVQAPAAATPILAPVAP